MRTFLVLLSAFVSAGLASLHASLKCVHVESSDIIDCSDVASPKDIATVMGYLSGSGQKKLKGFLLNGNRLITSLPKGMLWDIQFQEITITNNPNLSSMGDILGASKDTVLKFDISNNLITDLPRVESPSMNHFKMNGPSLNSIASNALDALPNLRTIDLQGAGFHMDLGLVIGEGAFMNLPYLEELNLKDYYPKDHLATRGSFTFNSASLRTVNLIGSAPIMTAEVGTFGGFNANSTLSLLLNAPIAVESFYNVFNSGAHVRVQEAQPCGNHLEWLSLNCFLPQTSIMCVVRQDFVPLAQVNKPLQHC